jgi:hypothetical protein
MLVQPADQGWQRRSNGIGVGAAGEANRRPFEQANDQIWVRRLDEHGSWQSLRLIKIRILHFEIMNSHRIVVLQLKYQPKRQLDITSL